MSQTKELGKDLAYQSKSRRYQLLINIVVILGISYFLASYSIYEDNIWYFNPYTEIMDNYEDMIFYFSSVAFTVLAFWIFFFYNGKLKPTLDIIVKMFMLEGVGRFETLSNEIFYQQPIIIDGLKKNKLSLFTKNYNANISKIFDFEDKNPTTARIVKYFKNNNNYIEYFKIIEGYLNENQYDAIYEYDINSAAQREAYRAYDNGTVYFSSTLVKQELNFITKDFSRYLEANITKPTSVSKKIRAMRIQEKNKIVDAFAFVIFHKIIINFTNIPTGLVESKLDDYDFRRIINYYQYDGFTIEISNDNNGTNKSFSNDTFSATFLTLYNKYMDDGSNQINVKNILAKFNPLMDIRDEKIELNLDLTVKDISEITDESLTREENI